MGESRERELSGFQAPGAWGAATYPNGGDCARNPEFSLDVSNLRCQLGPGEVEQILVYRCICGRLYIYRVFKALKLNEVTQRMDRYKVRGVIWDSPSSGGRRSGEPGKEQA